MTHVLITVLLSASAYLCVCVTRVYSSSFDISSTPVVLLLHNYCDSFVFKVLKLAN